MGVPFGATLATGYVVRQSGAQSFPAVLCLGIGLVKRTGVRFIGRDPVTGFGKHSRKVVGKVRHEPAKCLQVNVSGVVAMEFQHLVQVVAMDRALGQAVLCLGDFDERRIDGTAYAGEPGCVSGSDQGGPVLRIGNIRDSRHPEIGGLGTNFGFG